VDAVGQGHEENPQHNLRRNDERGMMSDELKAA
jgi:hypothetical protein